MSDFFPLLYSVLPQPIALLLASLAGLGALATLVELILSLWRTGAVARVNRVTSLVSVLVPDWFFEAFGSDVLYDIVQLRRDEGWRVAWLQAIELVLRFGLRRRHRCRVKDTSQRPGRVVELEAHGVIRVDGSADLTVRRTAISQPRPRRSSRRR